MIGLIDCNNFYASCERVFNPKLEGKPIGILSNNDGCVIARSNELKPLVPMGMPAYKIEPKIRKKIKLLSSNYELYGDMSQRVFDTVRHYTADIEPYSIDEAFIHLNGFNNVLTHCQNLKTIVKRDTGIPVSIGIAPTRTLAKLANHIAKKQPIHQGVYCLPTNQEAIKTILKQFSIEDIWGVGWRIAQRLKVLDIHTAWDLHQANLKQIRQLFSVVLERTVLELRGINCIELDDLSTPKKNIMTSRSFGHLTSDLFDIQEAIRVHASRGAEKLRKQKSVASAVLVFLKTNRFRPELPQYNPSIVVPLLSTTDDSRLIIHAAQKGLQSIYKKGFLFMKSGVMLLDLKAKDDYCQSDLFIPDISETQKSEQLMKTMDYINQKMGKNTIHLGGIRQTAAWQIKRDMLSQRYTTRWEELPFAK
ncbi:MULTISPECIES: Y-family DNA polymerase [unclassified Gilliamella]|uniref:Y-family DNA polymerase n=1 Tax=unclassified Gilliamella TaxID=2685620 RepID=UPI00226A6910|nr:MULTISPECIES: Y-family DNA polymerase [unclassified Gilliamella]MCX8659810.1 Y-family DNA polymerase [Gilliamella sp. B2772]MCX8663622.1 Y-family DNA polymerase [Gilliamella sp. B2911]MCX8671320.1 Y-family DNA polymerase [Gilliamella sp. B2785]MCX8675629.1 Y-family DNA polymerase [Gilliamella sp. B3023]MCX8679758.1 Y-family DNA polymerase [Gilliamella sp. B2865]